MKCCRWRIRPSVVSRDRPIEHEREQGLTSARRWGRTVLIGSIVAAFVASGAPTLAAKRADPKIAILRQQRQAVVVRQRLAASRINVLKASDRKLAMSLRVLAGAEDSQAYALDEAERERQRADSSVAVARRRVANAEVRTTEARALVALAALRSYSAADVSSRLDDFRVHDMNLAARRTVYRDLAIRSSASAADQLRAAEQDRAVALGVASAAARRATTKSSAVAARLRDLRAAKTKRIVLTAAVENRLEQALAESASLESLSAQVSGELTTRQAALVAAIQADEARQRRLRDRLGRGAVAGVGGSGAGAIANDALPSGPIIKPTGPKSGQITSVNGISVDSSLADSLRQLLAAAGTDGISLSGGGYRDSQQQIALRRAHCGTSDYAIYQARASSCSPPTARPGQSMHEQGLAIDFTGNGSLVTSRGSAAYRWLRANAGRFGLTNLPSEPWHWSTNGN